MMTCCRCFVFDQKHQTPNTEAAAGAADQPSPDISVNAEALTNGERKDEEVMAEVHDSGANAS